MAGSFLRQVKKTPEIAPLVLIVSGACVGAIGMTIRAAMRNPDASWDRANNQHPWLKIKPNEQVKLYSHSDYSKFESDRPSDPGKSD
ncbi:NADH dehydrogenase 1 alpha subcomplex subunit 4 ndufa4 [Porites harrisoni]|uniref:cytochrome c oxidase subunit NDUFA4-like n=1 Tax=Porites lutea TaxID=51062 RepID=UPI003CC5D98C